MEDLLIDFQPRWMPSNLDLLDSAEPRLDAIERRLEQDPELKVHYHNFMKEYEDSGHMEPVKSQEEMNTCYFLPHHPGFKKTISTTKTRLVFGGAKTSNGLSLDDKVQVGHTVQKICIFCITVQNQTGVLHS